MPPKREKIVNGNKIYHIYIFCVCMYLCIYLKFSEKLHLERENYFSQTHTHTHICMYICMCVYVYNFSEKLLLYPVICTGLQMVKNNLNLE